MLVGDATAYGVLRPMVGLSGIALPDNPEELILPAGRAAGVGASELPDEAVVCSCNNVTKGATSSRPPTRTDDDHPRGVHRAGDLRLLQAGREEDRRGLLRRQGKVVDRSLCEHFPLTRQELFDVVAVHGYTPLRPDRRGATAAAAGATSASRRSPRSWPASSTATCSTDATRRAAGHQRRLPRQHPAQRHLLGRAADPRRRDHPGEADRDRRGRPRLRALHQDHRRPADRPVRRPDGGAARRSGGGWSTPASSPATPTARRCGP